MVDWGQVDRDIKLNSGDYIQDREGDLIAMSSLSASNEPKEMGFLEKMVRGLEKFSEVDFSKELGLDAAWNSTKDSFNYIGSGVGNFAYDQAKEFDTFWDGQSRQFSKNAQSATRYVLGDGFTLHSGGSLGFHHLLSSATATGSRANGFKYAI